MPRKPRPTAAGLYHVAARATAGERLFRDEHDFLRFRTELEHAVAREDCTCIAFCALATHYHVLLETGDDALPRAMKRLNERYARAYNARYGRRGHAFADRYLAVPVNDSEQLLTVFRYIAHNPMEAGLCSHPSEWPWSSYAATVGLVDNCSFVDPGLVLGCCDESVDVLRRFVEDDSGA